MQTKQKTYDLEYGIFKAIEKIKKLKEKQPGNIVVLIAGGSASGKTSQVAKKILSYFESSAILLSMDNYYRGMKYYKEHNINFDQPEALNLELFFEHLKKLKDGKSVKIPTYDFKNYRPIMDSLEIKPKKIIIIEGLFALYDKIPKLGDIKIFVDLGTHGRILRRIFRDVQRTGQKPKEILEYFLDTVEPMDDKYIEPTKKNADFIISNEYDPFLESKKTNILDLQKKYDLNNYSIEKISEVLLKLGAQYIGNLDYTDYYFSPDYTDGRIVGNNEILLIRKIEFGKYVLIYKGPLKKNKEFEERYMINFLVDADTVDDFREIYGDDIIILSRKRISFFYEGISIFLDLFENQTKKLEIKFEKCDKSTKLKIENIFKQLNNN